MKGLSQALHKMFSLYRDGFKNMPGWGRKMWLIIIIKLFILFAVLRLFFFPDFLGNKFDNDSDKGSYVRDQIINYQLYND